MNYKPVFTDEDLERLKEELNMGPLGFVPPKEEMFALIARLEAAEKCLDEFDRGTDYFAPSMKEWREITGKNYKLPTRK